MSVALASFSRGPVITRSLYTYQNSHGTASDQRSASPCHSRLEPNRTARSARSRLPACNRQNRGNPLDRRRDDNRAAPGAAADCSAPPWRLPWPLPWALALGAGGLRIYYSYAPESYAPEQSDGEPLSANRADNRRPAPRYPRYRCDGRTYCSQMTSCAEARFFLKHCPGVKMDGNNDGEPCERQWCQ